MIVIKRKILVLAFTIIMLFSLTAINSSAATVTPKASGIGDSADYLLDVPDENNSIYYTNWKAHGLSWTSFEIFGKSQYDPTVFSYNKNSGYIYTKTIGNENFYEAEFNNDVSAYGIIEGCNIIAIQPVQIQFDKAAFQSGDNVSLGNYIDTTSYKYIATRVKVESKNNDPKAVSVMLRAKGRDQYIDNMVGTYLINNKTRKVIGPYPDLKYVELESDFDGWIVMPVADMAEGKPLSELVTVSFFCHSEGLSDKCSHKIENTSWTDSTLYIGDMMLVKDINAFNTARTSCNNLSHSYGEPQIVNATANTKGTSTLTCTACGHKEVSYLASALSGKSVEGVAATVKITGKTNITEDVILKAENITSTVATKDKNTIIRGVNSLSDEISSRKLASIFDLKLITREKDSSGKNIDTEFSSTGTLNITIPLETTIINNYKNLNIILVADDGTAKLIESSTSNGKITFSTESLGYFALVGGTKTASEASSDNKSQASNSSAASSNNEKNSSDKATEITSDENQSTESVTTIINDSSTSTNNANNKLDTTPVVLVIVIGAIAVCGLIFVAIMLLRKSK